MLHSCLYTPHRLTTALVFAALLGAHAGAQAGPFLTNKAYDLTVNVNGSYSAASDTISGGTGAPTLGFNTVEDLFNKTQNNGLTEVNATYTNNSASVIRFGYRGLPMVLVTQANSSTIELLIPTIGEAVRFQLKPTRDANLDDLKEYLKSKGGDILNRLQQSLAKNSPIDPIAGNPSSMQARMVDGDFDRNFTQFASNIKSTTTQGSTEPTNNLVGIGLGYGNYTQGGLATNTVTLPLSYTTRPELDPRRQLTIYAPITVTDVANAKSYGVNFGVSYRIPMNDDWALTPGLGYGVSGSVDLGSAAAMMTASVTSQYSLQMDGYDLAIGNMIGLYQSSKFAVGDYSFDPKISNTVFRNGVMASFPTTLQGKKMALEVSFVNTLYTGTALYSNQSNEIGITLGTNKSANAARSYLRAGLTYVVAEKDINGFKLNVGYWF